MGIKLLQSVYVHVSHRTELNGSSLAIRAQGHEGVMEHIDVAQAAQHFAATVRFSAQPKLLSSLQGQISFVIHFERDISLLAHAGMTFPLVEGWS